MTKTTTQINSAKQILSDRVLKEQPSREIIRGRCRDIREQTLRHSQHIQRPNFTQIGPTDLQKMFCAYDDMFLEGACQSVLDLQKWPLTFRLSSKMTRAGGKTVRKETYSRDGDLEDCRFEIVISSTLLFSTFCENDRAIRVAGLACENRLDALMRVMEHELIHLVEMLCWRDSSCALRRFQDISRRFFEHKEANHQLITPTERAMRDQGIRPGDTVRFHFQGQDIVGKVNRITRRATVLVPDKSGELYSDGKRYQKFYVPVEQLARC